MTKRKRKDKPKHQGYAARHRPGWADPPPPRNSRPCSTCGAPVDPGDAAHIAAELGEDIDVSICLCCYRGQQAAARRALEGGEQQPVSEVAARLRADPGYRETHLQAARRERAFIAGRIGWARAAARLRRGE